MEPCRSRIFSGSQFDMYSLSYMNRSDIFLQLCTLLASQRSITRHWRLPTQVLCFILLHQRHYPWRSSLPICLCWVLGGKSCSFLLNVPKLTHFFFNLVRTTFQLQYPFNTAQLATRWYSQTRHSYRLGLLTRLLRQLLVRNSRLASNLCHDRKRCL
jgi:hypothetical protein